MLPKSTGRRVAGSPRADVAFYSNRITSATGMRMLSA